MEKIKVWDLPLRIFHWSLVAGFAANLTMDADSKWHIWIGYGIIALVAFRVIWGFVGSRYARFSSFKPSIANALEHINKIREGHVETSLGHNPLGALMVYNLLLTICAIAATGYMMTTLRFFGLEWVEELHEAFVNWAIFSIIAHVGGVIFESRRSKENLAKSMVTGYKAQT